MRRMGAAVFLIFMVSLTSPGQDQVDSRTIAKKIEPSVLSVAAYDKGGRVLERSTGFFASELGDVITRRRAFPAGTHRAEVRTVDGKTYRVIAVATEYKEIDIVRLWVELSSDKVKPVEAAAAAPRTGERVVVISMPEPERKRVTEGVIAVIEDLERGRFIQVNATLPEGSTGSPVVNGKGEVIGVALYLRSDHATFIANGAEKIRGWANDLSPGADPIRSLGGEAVKRVMPSYPWSARAARVTGTVVVQVIIDEKGKVRAARALFGPLELRETAVSAAYKWQFTPTVKDGVPTETVGTISFNFTP